MKLNALKEKATTSPWNPHYCLSIFERLLSSDKSEELDRQTREDFLKQCEKILGKNCILFRNLED